MNKPVILAVFGTRPEAIKLAPVVRALRASADLTTRLCVTAQHRQMLDRMLSNFGLRPDFDLDLMQANQDLNGFSARALPRLQEVLRRLRPDFVLVQGDTTTAFVTALAAFYERVPVGHVEAGLRSFDRGNPYPEETNRVMISRLSDLHFVPTRGALANLLAEGIPEANIIQTGNTVVDALLHHPLIPRSAARSPRCATATRRSSSRPIDGRTSAGRSSPCARRSAYSSRRTRASICSTRST